jgi:hypothetical protein
MNNRTKVRASILVFAATLSSPMAWIQAVEASTNSQPIVLTRGPLSELVAVGTSVTLIPDLKALNAVTKSIYTKSKLPMSAPPLTYQWRVNGQEIPGATNSSYTNYSVALSDAASYTVVVSGGLELETAPVHLSVFQLISGHSNGGALSTGIQNFTAGSGNTVCGAPGFDRYKTYMLFYGSNAPSQTGPFFNHTNYYLDLDTCTNRNGTNLDTAIQFQGNWLGTPVIACTNDCSGCANDTLLSTITNIPLSSSSSSSNTYRTTIFYKESTREPDITNVTFRWYYHN